jgi:hypothetical protein
VEFFGGRIRGRGSKGTTGASRSIAQAVAVGEEFPPPSKICAFSMTNACVPQVQGLFIEPVYSAQDFTTLNEDEGRIQKKRRVTVT